MRSITIASDADLDGADAALDILRQLGDFPLKENSCGILIVEPTCDYEEALATLRAELGHVPLIGATSLAQLSKSGYRKLGLTLLLLTADDCWFSIAGVDNLNENGEEKIRAVYNEALAGLEGKEPAGAFVFSKLTPNMPERAKLVLLDELIGQKPIVGGIASDNYTRTTEHVFVNDTIYSGGYAILLVAGNFRPIVNVGSVPNKGLARYHVTESEGNVLKSIDNTPIIDFLVSNGVNIDTPVGLLFAPFSDIAGDSNGVDTPVCRPLMGIDKEKGIAKTHVNMPQGSMVSFQIIEGAHLKLTAEEAARKTLKQIEDSAGSGYEYSTLFCVTCAGRHAVLAFEHEYEGIIARQFFADKMEVAGFYGFAEIGPTSIAADGCAKNNTHNLSVIFCAF